MGGNSCTEYSLRKRCPYSKLFWSVFSRIWTECGEIRGRDVSKIYDGPVTYIRRDAPL